MQNRDSSFLMLWYHAPPRESWQTFQVSIGTDEIGKL